MLLGSISVGLKCAVVVVVVVPLLVVKTNGILLDNCNAIVNSTSSVTDCALLCAASIDRTIWLVTRDLLVFQIGNTKLVQNHLYLDNSVQPMPMQLMWPNFMHSNLSRNFSYCFFARDSASTYFLNLGQDDSNLSFIYKIDESIYNSGFSYHSRIFPLSSSDSYEFYGISVYDSDGTLAIQQLTFPKSNGEMFQPFSTKPVAVIASTQARSLCYGDSNGSSVVIRQSADTKCDHLKLVSALQTGFVDDSTFYLFGHDLVVIFSKEAFLTEKSFPLLTLTFKEFFICATKQNYNALVTEETSTNEANKEAYYFDLSAHQTDSRQFCIVFGLFLLSFLCTSSICLYAGLSGVNFGKILKF